MAEPGRMWGVHNNDPTIDFVEGGFVAVGSLIDRDVSTLARDRERLKAAMAAKAPDANPRAIANWAGVLFRFVTVMQVGDLVVHPSKADSTVAIGRIASEYIYDPAAGDKPHRRNVEWLRTGLPRTTFTQDALYEIGAYITVFEIRRYTVQFIREVGLSEAEAPVEAGQGLEEPDLAALDEPSATRIEESTRDFVIRTINERIEGVEFEHLVANVLQAMGYETRVTEASGDGGVDVLAYRDRLGLEPPIIKVQCKRTTSTIGAPIVQALIGTLAPGGTERALFVTLGGFSKDARQISLHRHDLRLIDGPAFVDLLIEHYDSLAAKYRRLLPMRPVYVVDQDVDLS